MLDLNAIFNCSRCREWYVRNPEEAPGGMCKHCYWDIPLNRKSIVPQETIAELMARELEGLLADG